MKIHETLAVEDSLKSAAASAETLAQRNFRNPSPFDGQIREYLPKTEEDAKKDVESKAVIDTVPARLAAVAKAMTAFLDIVATKEEANTRAKEDIAIEGIVLAKDVPVSMLVQLENKFRSFRNLISEIPVLDPLQNWSASDKKGVYKGETREVQSTKKVMRPVELAPATDKHPAQVKETNVDVVCGTWATTLLSGRISQENKDIYLDRVDTLIREIKKARQRANTCEVVQQNYAKNLLDFILT